MYVCTYVLGFPELENRFLAHYFSAVEFLMDFSETGGGGVILKGRLPGYLKVEFRVRRRD